MCIRDRLKGAGSTCQGGVCSPPACGSPNTMCSSGCTDTQTDPANCGACSTACSSANVSQLSCASGMCTSTCDTGYRDCDNNLQADGCETDINTDGNNCGGCGNNCVALNGAGSTCQGGVCLSLIHI